MTDTGLTNTPPQNAGGDYRVKYANVTLDGLPRRITGGQLRGAALRNALEVGREFDIFRRITTADGTNHERIEDDTVYSVADGRAYRTKRRGLPEGLEDLAVRTMAEECGAADVLPGIGEALHVSPAHADPDPTKTPPGARERLADHLEAARREMPPVKPIRAATLDERVEFLERENQKRVTMAKQMDALPRIEAAVEDLRSGNIALASEGGQARKEIEARLERIESAVAHAHDEAKRARTYAENIEAHGRNAEQRLESLAEAADRTEATVKAIAQSVQETPHAPEVRVQLDGEDRLLVPGEYTGMELRHRFRVPTDRCLWTPTVMGTLTVIADLEKAAITEGQRFYTTPA